MKSRARSSREFLAFGLVLLFIFGFAGNAFGQKKPRFAYVANVCHVTNPFDCTSGNVSAYTIDSTTGALTPVSGSPFAAEAELSSVAVDPSGKFTYVANGCRSNPFDCTSGNVSAYTIDSTTGALIPISGSPVAAGANPRSVAVDPSGKFAYVANAVCSKSFCSPNGNVSAYIIDSTTGALTPVSGSSFATGSNPSSVAVDPSGKFAYVANQGSNDVSAYTIDSTTGALAAVSGSPFAVGRAAFPRSVAVDPSGKFAYVANQGSNDVSAYTIDSTTGALSPVSGSPFATGSQPLSMSVDPSGKFAYVANHDSNNVSAYTIDSTTGALSPVSGSPFSTGTSTFPLSVAVGDGPYLDCYMILSPDLHLRLLHPCAEAVGKSFQNKKSMRNNI